MDRPSTSNPKRQTFASHQLVAEISHSDAAVSTPFKEPSMQLDPGVIWSSDESGVPEGMLARPHTSNPRYVEMSQRDASPAAASKRSLSTQHNNPSPASSKATPFVPVGGLPSAGPTFSNTNPSSNGPTPISSGRAYVGEDFDTNRASPCFADGEGSPYRFSKVYEGPAVGVIWASDSYSVDPQLLARPITSNPWLQRVFDSVEPLGETDDVAQPPTLSKQRHSQILWSSADVNDWRMLARPHTSNPLLEKMDRGATVEDVPQGKGSTILWRREETVEELQGIIQSQQTRIRHLEAAVSQLSAQLSRNYDRSPTAPRTTDPPSPATEALLAVGRGISEGGLPATGKPEEEEVHILSFESETPSRILQPSPIQEAPSPIAEESNHRSTSSCGHRAPVLLSDAETERYIRNDVNLVGGEDAVAEYNKMKHALRDEARFRQVSNKPHDEEDDGFAAGEVIPFRPPNRPESALPSRRAAQLRQKVSQCRPSTAMPARRPVPAAASSSSNNERDDKPLRPMSARPMTINSWQSHPSNRVREPVSLREYLQANHVTPCFTNVNAFPSNLSATKSVGFLAEDNFSTEYSHLLRRGEKYVLKDDFKQLYLDRAEEFGVTVSNREVERSMEKFHSVGSGYLSPQEFAILYLKVAQW